MPSLVAQWLLGLEQRRTGWENSGDHGADDGGFAPRHPRASQTEKSRSKSEIVGS
jgi:hypothetical protein